MYKDPLTYSINERRDLPIVYIPDRSTTPSALGQCDCACASVTSAIPNVQEVLVSDDARKKGMLNNAVFLDTRVAFLPADDRHVSVFHPLHGLMFVANASGIELLNTFRQPLLLKDLLQRTTKSFHATLERFVALALVLGVFKQKNQPEYNIAVQDNSDTLTAWLHVTNQCQLQCQYCYVRRNHEQMSEQTARAALQKIFATAASRQYQNVMIKYAGGEPTLVPDFLIRQQKFAETLAEQYNISLKSTILTNGVAIPEHLIAFSAEHDMAWAVSLDTLHQGQKVAHQVMASLEKLQAWQCSLQVTITVTQENLTELPELIDILSDKHIRFTINFYREHGKQNQFSDLRPDNDALIGGLQQVYQRLEKRLPRHSLLSSLLDRVDLRAPHPYPCSAGRHYLTIDHQGHIAPCQIYVSRPSTHRDEPNNAFTNPNVSEKDECSPNCLWQYFCAGGCPADALHTFGRSNARSLYCHVYKALAPEVLRLEALRMIHHEQPVKWNEAPFKQQ